MTGHEPAGGTPRAGEYNDDGTPVDPAVCNPHHVIIETGRLLAAEGYRCEISGGQASRDAILGASMLLRALGLRPVIPGEDDTFPMPPAVPLPGRADAMTPAESAAVEGWRADGWDIRLSEHQATAVRTAGSATHVLAGRSVTDLLRRLDDAADAGELARFEEKFDRFIASRERRDDKGDGRTAS